MEEPRDVGQGSRHEDHVAPVQPVGLQQLVDLAGEASVGVDDALGRPRGPGGEHDQGILVGRRLGSGGSVNSDEFGRRDCSGGAGEWQPGGGDAGGRPELVEDGRSLGGAYPGVQRRGDRSEAPAGPVEHHGVWSVGDLEGPWVAAAHPPLSEPGSGRPGRSIDLGAGEPPAVGDHQVDPGRRRGEEVVEAHGGRVGGAGPQPAPMSPSALSRMPLRISSSLKPSSSST